MSRLYGYVYLFICIKTYKCIVVLTRAKLGRCDTAGFLVGRVLTRIDAFFRFIGEGLT